jgi:hypothetical protein
MYTARRLCRSWGENGHAALVAGLVTATAWLATFEATFAAAVVWLIMIFSLEKENGRSYVRSLDG